MGNLEESWSIDKIGGGSYSANTGPTAVRMKKGTSKGQKYICVHE